MRTYLALVLVVLGNAAFAEAQEESAPATDPTRWRVRLGEHLPALQAAETAVSELAPVIDEATRQLQTAAQAYAGAPTEENLTRWFAAASKAISEISQRVKEARLQRPQWVEISERARSQLIGDLERGRAAVREHEQRVGALRERAVAAERRADELRRSARRQRDSGRDLDPELLAEARRAHRAVTKAHNTLLLEEGRRANRRLNVAAMSKAATMLDAAEERLWAMYTDLDLFAGELEIAAERLSILMDMQETRDAWAILARLGSRVREIGVERKGFASAIDALAQEAGKETPGEFETPIEVRSAFEAWLLDTPLYQDSKQGRSGRRMTGSGPKRSSGSGSASKADTTGTEGE